MTSERTGWPQAKEAAKPTDGDAAVFRKKFRTGTSVAELAKLSGVKPEIIAAIVTGRPWR